MKEGSDCNDNRDIYCDNSTSDGEISERDFSLSKTWLETITKRLYFSVVIISIMFHKDPYKNRSDGH